MSRVYRVGPLGKWPADPLAEPVEDAFDGDPADGADLPSAAAQSAEQRESVIGAELHGVRLDRAVVAMAGEFSRSHLQTLIAGGHVRIDGQPSDAPARRVKAGQRISVDLLPTAESRAFRAEPMALAIVFEDDQLLVVDKPAGLVVHPAAGHWSGTLLNGVLAHHAAAAGLPRAGIVHRLDKDTSGLMVVGKTLTAVTALVRQIAARDVHRQYLAITHGAVAAERLRVAEPIGRDPRSPVRMAVVASGKPARTDVERLAIATLDGRSYTAVRCTLHTGRTHQIRVHMASIGNPLLADSVYGGRCELGLQRQALHATWLAFVHPLSGRALQFVAAPPADFALAWTQLTKTA